MLKTQTLIDQLAARRPTLSRAIAQGYVEDFLGLIKVNLEGGFSVSLGSVGQLRLRQGAQRFGRNPKTGTKVIIPPKVRCKFVVAPTLNLTQVNE